MSISNPSSNNCHFTPRATLIGLGVRTECLRILETIGQYVDIQRKVILDSPSDKLTDTLITILAGGQGLYEANKRVRTDPALQRAFGRERCTEQSVISEMLNTCTVENVNRFLERGFQLHTKGYSSKRARQLAESVTQWYDDPRQSRRQVGWMTILPSEYSRPVKRIAVRTRKKNGQWSIGVHISTLSWKLVDHLTGLTREQLADPLAGFLAYVHYYDQRGGGVEIEI